MGLTSSFLDILYDFILYLSIVVVRSTQKSFEGRRPFYVPADRAAGPVSPGKTAAGSQHTGA